MNGDRIQPVDFEEYREGLISKDELFQRICLPKEDWQLAVHSKEIGKMLYPAAIYDLDGRRYDVTNYLESNP